MKTIRLRPQMRGLTLIELMMAVAIAAILMAMAVPSFHQAVGSSRLSTAAGELTAAVQLARAEAIRNNRRVTLCRSVDGSACDGSSSIWGGWIVFVDSDGDGVRGAAEPIVKSGTLDAPLQTRSSASLTALGERITFHGDGTARAVDGQTLLTGTLSICLADSQPADNVRSVSLAAGTRTAARRSNAGGLCTTPTDA
jgi:type IV fimbrial biogenesis protein FimT